MHLDSLTDLQNRTLFDSLLELLFLDRELRVTVNVVLAAVRGEDATHGIVVSAYPPFRVESEPQK